jgi:hypothetical protein
MRPVCHSPIGQQRPQSRFLLLLRPPAAWRWQVELAGN